MEYAKEGDVEIKIKKMIKDKRFFSEKEIWTIFCQIVLGLKCLHDKKIMHRDLKSANVFLKGNEVKLGDLNVSKVIKSGLAFTQTGTPYYASPEVWNDKPYEYKSDIWSLGCVIYEICCFKPPFKGNNLDQLFQSVNKGAFDSIPSFYSKDLDSLIKKMLNLNPNKRPSCDEILSNITIQNYIKLTYPKDVIDNLGLNFNFSSITKIHSDDKTINSQLIETITFPKNLTEINKKLPVKKYNEFPITVRDKTPIKILSEISKTEITSRNKTNCIDSICNDKSLSKMNLLKTEDIKSRDHIKSYNTHKNELVTKQITNTTENNIVHKKYTNSMSNQPLRPYSVVNSNKILINSQNNINTLNLIVENSNISVISNYF